MPIGVLSSYAHSSPAGIYKKDAVETEKLIR